MAKIGGAVSIETATGMKLFWSDDGTAAGNLRAIDPQGDRVSVDAPVGDNNLLWRNPDGEVVALEGEAVSVITLSGIPTVLIVGRPAPGWAPTRVGGKAPFLHSISSGALPPGVTQNSSTGARTGTPEGI